MKEHAQEVASFVKAMAHLGRLQILLRLMEGEKNVSDLCRDLSMHQAGCSQLLIRLRLEGLVSTRRDGKEIYYSISDYRVRRLIVAIQDILRNEERTQ
ncbi:MULTISPECIES: helix-turn-helix transcriptional regulator [unclassified Ruegeria]|uniref:ArsR/SmtB family transcription factor n=1 Tax=unclassified Ruegeria TaxID=2625375 RepID=UPI00148924E3|nr:MULTISPECIES: metalloregulator ArsR/SmtB family transcription factor [unclassified Ruegeria]